MYNVAARFFFLFFFYIEYEFRAVREIGNLELGERVTTAQFRISVHAAEQPNLVSGSQFTHDIESYDRDRGEKSDCAPFSSTCHRVVLCQNPLLTVHSHFCDTSRSSSFAKDRSSSTGKLQNIENLFRDGSGSQNLKSRCFLKKKRINFGNVWKSNNIFCTNLEL